MNRESYIVTLLSIWVKPPMEILLGDFYPKPLECNYVTPSFGTPWNPRADPESAPRCPLYPLPRALWGVPGVGSIPQPVKKGQVQ